VSFDKTLFDEVSFDEMTPIIAVTSSRLVQRKFLKYKTMTIQF
jgi:hypothetical protein